MTTLLQRSAALPHWVLPAGTAVAAAAACTTVALVDPSEPGRYPTCPFLALTGRWCPGCGSLRGLHHLFRADLPAALGLNALMVLAVPFLVWSWVAWAVPRIRGPGSLRLAQVVLVVVVAFWLARNLPWLAWLAPPAA